MNGQTLRQRRLLARMRAVSPRVFHPVPPPDDGLDAARGILVAVVVGVFVWLIAIGVIVWVWSN